MTFFPFIVLEGAGVIKEEVESGVLDAETMRPWAVVRKVGIIVSIVGQSLRTEMTVSRPEQFRGFSRRSTILIFMYCSLIFVKLMFTSLLSLKLKDLTHVALLAFGTLVKPKAEQSKRLMLRCSAHRNELIKGNR